MKEIFYSDEARRKLQAGVDKLANAVKTTLGPKGKVAVFERGTPIFSLDGVTVAKQIVLRDEAEQMGVKLLQRIASKTDKEGGDGTTTATILAQSMLHQGIKALSSGIDHTQLKKGMDTAGKIAIDYIKKTAKKLEQEDISDVATISSRDRDVGDLIAEIYKELGNNVNVSVEEDKSVGVQKELVKGLKFDKGFIAPHFMNDPQRGETILENPYILVTSQIISTHQDIGRILEDTFKHKGSLVVIADNVKGEALATLIINKLKNILACVAISAPGFGDDKLERLEDIAILTGATYVSEQTGIKMEDANLEHLGRAKKIIVTQDDTTIIMGAGDKKTIKDRIKYLKSQIETEKSDYKKDLKQKRLATLEGNMAIIKVGSYSEEETTEKRYRIEDAVKSVKSAVEEGITPGAGMCLMEASREISEKMKRETDLSYRAGMGIVGDAIQEPARQIIINAGGKPDVILSKCQGTFGYDSATNEYCDLLERGIIDSAKVVRSGLQNALSVASMFLITETLIVDEKDPKKENKSDS